MEHRSEQNRLPDHPRRPLGASAGKRMTAAGSRADTVDAELLAEALELAAHNRRSHWSVEGQTAARQTVPPFTLGSFLNHDNS